MSGRTSTHVSSNGSSRASQAEAVHAALRTLLRSLFSVDDTTMDLPLRQIKVCLALYRKSRSMSEIGRELGLSPSAVTQVSDRLVRRGLIERTFPDDDRRVRKLRLTRKGHKLMRAREQKQLGRIADALDTLSNDEFHQIMTGFGILIRSCAPQEVAAD